MNEICRQTQRADLLLSLTAAPAPRGVVIEKSRCHITPGKEYMAIVYEYIEDSENDETKVQEFLDFMYLAGFCPSSSHGRNWKSSMPVDFSDFISVASFGWRT